MFNNPVLSKEIKVRMRGWKSPAMIAIYIGVLAAVTAFVLSTSMDNPYNNMMDSNNFIAIYTVIATLQFLLIIFITPALTAGSISGERERQTLDLLLCTKISTISIIVGKLFASINQIILLIVSSIPILSVVFLFGGITIGELVKLFLFLIIISITIGSIGIFCSTFIKKTTTSNVTTYAVILFLILGTAFFAAVYVRLTKRVWKAEDIFPLMYANPLAGFVSLVAEQLGNSNGFRMPGFYIGTSNNVKNIVLWKGNLIFDVVLSTILIFLSSVKINPVKRKFSFRKKVVAK